jgi:hypothetical protein
VEKIFFIFIGFDETTYFSQGTCLVEKCSNQNSCKTCENIMQVHGNCTKRSKGITGHFGDRLKKMR